MRFPWLNNPTFTLCEVKSSSPAFWYSYRGKNYFEVEPEACIPSLCVFRIRWKRLSNTASFSKDHETTNSVDSDGEYSASGRAGNCNDGSPGWRKSKPCHARGIEAAKRRQLLRKNRRYTRWFTAPRTVHIRNNASASASMVRLIPQYGTIKDGSGLH